MKTASVFILIITICNGAFADFCLDRAEQKYYSHSQNLMSGLETGKIDNIQFEKSRDAALSLRDKDLAICYQNANEELKLANERLEEVMDAMRLQKQLEQTQKAQALPRVPSSEVELDAAPLDAYEPVPAPSH